MKIVKGYGSNAVAFLFLYPPTQALHALTQALIAHSQALHAHSQALKDKTTIKIIIKTYCPCE